MRPGGSSDSDGAMSRALEAGLPAEHVAILMAARRHWWAAHAGRTTPVDPLTGAASAEVWGEALTAALAHPAAAAFDEVFVAAMRRHRSLR
jgi:hypothetical protein